jgi:hypothetical protein
VAEKGEPDFGHMTRTTRDVASAVDKGGGGYNAFLTCTLLSHTRSSATRRRAEASVADTHRNARGTGTARPSAAERVSNLKVLTQLDEFFSVCKRASPKTANRPRTRGAQRVPDDPKFDGVNLLLFDRFSARVVVAFALANAGARAPCVRSADKTIGSLSAPVYGCAKNLRVSQFVPLCGSSHWRSRRAYLTPFTLRMSIRGNVFQAEPGKLHDEKNAVAHRARKTARVFCRCSLSPAEIPVHPTPSAGRLSPDGRAPRLRD